MSESTVLSIRPVRTHTVTLPGTSSSGTIADVGTPDFSTGRRSRSTTSILTGSSQPELTINRLSGQLGAHQSRPRPPPHRHVTLAHAVGEHRSLRATAQNILICDLAATQIEAALCASRRARADYVA